MSMAPKGQCECHCHYVRAKHMVACCERSGELYDDPPEPPKWKKPAVMWLKPGSGEKQECQVCGKEQFPVIHSCSGIPRTQAAVERWAQAYRDDPE